MRQFHYFHEVTGEFHSKVFKCDPSTPYAEKDALANAPSGHVPLEGHYVEHWKLRVDPKTKEVSPITPN